jgi:hypothetical protein
VLPAAADEHSPALFGELSGQLLHQAGLADSWLAAQEEQATLAGGSLLQRGAQLPQLLDTTDERSCRLARRGAGHQPALLAAGIGRIGHSIKSLWPRTGAVQPCPVLANSGNGGPAAAPGPRGGPRFGVRTPDLYMVREEHTV